MVLSSRPTVNDSPCKQKGKNPRLRRSRRKEKLSKDAPEFSDVKPKRLDFDEASDDAHVPDAEEPSHEDTDNPPETPDAKKSRNQPEDKCSPKRSPLDGDDDDLFSGDFARPKLSPQIRVEPVAKASSSRRCKKSPKKSPKKLPVQKQPDSSLPPTRPPTRSEEKDEEDIKKDEVLKLMDRIRENRLMSIIPLDCNAKLARIHSCVFSIMSHYLLIHAVQSSLRRDRKYFLQILVQEDLLTVRDAAENLNFGEGSLSCFSSAGLECCSHFGCYLHTTHEPGDVMDYLGHDSKRSFSNLTLKGKRAVRRWPQVLQELLFGHRTNMCSVPDFRLTGVDG